MQASNWRIDSTRCLAGYHGDACLVSTAAGFVLGSAFAQPSSYGTVLMFRHATYSGKYSSAIGRAAMHTKSSTCDGSISILVMSLKRR
jgi:hypothetical protein